MIQYRFVYREQVRFAGLDVVPDYLDFFGFEILDGRGFIEEDAKRPTGSYIVNEAFLRAYPSAGLGSAMKGIRIGHSDTEAQIVGVVKDFHFQDLRHPMEPFAFYCSGETDGPGSSDSRYYRVAVKTVSGKADAVADRLPAILDRISGEEGAARATLLERTARSFYADNERESMLVQTSSILSLLLSLLGVFGLIYLEVQTIRKGVAIRKVMGASTGHLLWMMLRKYLLLGTAVFAAAVPLSLWIIGRWKQQFAEQAAVPAWIFLLAWVLVLGATAVVISSMALAVSRTAPAAELQKE